MQEATASCLLCSLEDPVQFLAAPWPADTILREVDRFQPPAVAQTARRTCGEHQALYDHLF
eukprot:10964232-Lingulodinium_polyedra.AAC.1